MIYQNTTIRRAMSEYMTRLFTRVGIGILATFLISFSLATYLPKLAMNFFLNPLMFLLIAVGEISLVYIISNKVKKTSLTNLNLLFSLFIILNSLGITYIYFFFSRSEILFAASAAGAFFLSMGGYGYLTKRDLSNWGSILSVALLSIVAVSLLHMILSLFTGYRSSLIEILVSMATIIVISLHTAYEMNKYKDFFLRHSNANFKDGLVTLGALSLYLNYIIIFKNILQLMRYMRSSNDR